MLQRSGANQTLLPSIGLIIGGILWGLFWIPLREIGAAGVKGAWPGLFIYLSVAALLVPCLLLRPGLVRSSWRSLAWCGLFTGTAFSLYAISLFLTDVVRVLLLFYMTPVWSTILGAVLLKETVTLNRVFALIMGLAGLMVILGIGAQFPWPKNLGDWLALLAGVAWAYGSLNLYRLENTGVFEQVLVFVLGSLVVSAVVLLLAGDVMSPPLEIAAFRMALPMILFSTVFVLPMLFLTMWPASVLSPGRVGLLLMSEAIIGIASAGVLAGEPFGAREMIGSALIIGAGFVELMVPGATAERKVAN